ncbi:MAG TPA: energy-coupling factor transporter transmembrane component T [Patescibacteria group bacterium]|nr:energy-coupling factor transporter transmembrane component T [Patescibacteria group bacterium]
MLGDITLGQYYPGQSFVHRLDPRTKVLGLIAFISTVFLADSYSGYGILLTFSLLSIGVARIPLRLALKSIKPLWVIIVLTFGIHTLMTPGQVIASWGIFTVTAEGLRQAVMMSVRLVLIILMSSLMTFTTSPLSLTDGIEQLLNPFRRFGVPAHELAMMMTIAMRFIPTLLEETDRIMKAQMARGADFASGNILRRAKNMVPLLVPLFISAFRRADELATAMEARCYRGGENRTRMKELMITSRDWLAAIALGGLAVVLAVLRWGGGMA